MGIRVCECPRVKDGHPKRRRSPFAYQNNGRRGGFEDGDGALPGSAAELRCPGFDALAGASPRSWRRAALMAFWVFSMPCWLLVSGSKPNSSASAFAKKSS